MMTNGRSGRKPKLLSVVALAAILFCLVTARLLRVPYISGDYANSPDMATIFQTALSVSTSWSALDEDSMLNGAAQATRPSVEDLISALREATQKAARGEYFLMDLTGEERERWNRENSCKSRLELKAMYNRRKYASDVEEDDGLWDVVLEEYAKLHRVCMRRVGRENLKQYFENRNNSTGCTFAIADYSTGGGLGNKILAISNTVLYAILTQRVVLVPTSTLLPELTCEPFVGSSWVLDSNQFPVPPWENSYRHLWTIHKDVYQELDKMPSSRFVKDPPRSKLYSSSMEEYQYQPGSRFFCDVEQEMFKGVTWLYFTGCLYTIPKLFAIPAFRETLEELFPSRLVLTRMLRSVMLPNDLVWDRVVRADAEHLKEADRRVGLQIRYRHNMNEYVEMNAVVNERVLKCGLDNGFLPSTVDQDGTMESHLAQKNSVHNSKSSSSVKVFVASLYPGFADFANEKYLSHPKSTGEVVSLVQLSHEMSQTYGLEIDRQSLVEIIMLSFCDDIVVTPLSTFGGLAQAYGNLVPWILEFRKEVSHPPCERGQTVDVCYQEADRLYSCPYDRRLDKKQISDVVPYIQKCLTVDALDGLQLITKNSSGTEYFISSDSTIDLHG
ncbi:hypothetical protein Mapa_014171 [Marchantia paleacea]|nr:hypothetical protein Mapa_014171 [Marchantia paleacea]